MRPPRSRHGLPAVRHLPVLRRLAEAGPVPEAEQGCMKMHDYTCGRCGETFSTNCDEDDIQCTDCEARRCPCCGSWFGGE